MGKNEKFTDPRDGRKYRITKIGSQTWMAENLAYDCAGSKAYGNSIANVAKYGRLYDWESAKASAPPGWHLPKNEEWDELLRYVDGSADTDGYYDSPYAGRHLKAKSGWDGDGCGTDGYGFRALPGGAFRPDNPYASKGIGAFKAAFEGIGAMGFWWSDCECHDSNWRRGRYYYRYMKSDSGCANVFHYPKEYMFSVRLVRDRKPGEEAEAMPARLPGCADGDSSIKNALRLANAIAARLAEALEHLGEKSESADLAALGRQAKKLGRRIFELHRKAGRGKNFRADECEAWRALEFCWRHL